MTTASFLRHNLNRLCFNNSLSLLSLLPRFSTSAKTPTVYELLLHKHHFCPESASQVVSVRNPANADSVLSFLKESGFSKTQLEKMMKRSPAVLSSDLEKTVRPKIRVFQDLGFSADDIAVIICSNPDILKLSLNNKIIPAMSVLKSVLGPNAELAKCLKRSAWLLRNNADSSVVPNVEFLRNSGIAMEQISWLMYYFPRFLLSKPETLKKHFEKVEEMGISRNSRMFIHALRVHSSLSEDTWKLKVRNFKMLGFSDDDVAAVFRTAPLVFGVSVKKIKAVKDVVLRTGKYELSCMIKNPASFMCSVEKRYKPRLEILQALESKSLIRSWPGFGKLYSTSEKNFYEKFVGPYLDVVGDVYVAKFAISGKESKQILSASKLARS